jgi:hypothetical protein
MKHFALAVASFLFLAPTAFALQTDKCPAQFVVQISNISPYATSVSSKTPGWIPSRDALKTAGAELELTFTLDSTTLRSCEYSSPEAASAKLFTFSQFDAEDGVSYKSERLLVRFNLDGAAFSMFPSVETYDVDSIRLYSQDAPQKTKIQTRLVNPRTAKPFNFDVGLANIKTK